VTVSDRLRGAGILLRRDHAVIENLLLLLDLRPLIGMATAPFPEHRQLVPRAAATLPLPYHRLLVQLAPIHSHRHSHVEATQLLLRLLGHEVVAAAVLPMMPLAISLVLQRVVDLGAQDLVVVDSMAVELRPVLAAQVVGQRHLHRLSAGRATLLQPLILALCASAIIYRTCPRRSQVARRHLKSMTRAGSSSSRKMPESSEK
jgi:hypothetical protein